jgi:hypothetical protein
VEADMKKFIGIDLHSNNSVVVVSDEEDRVIFQKRMANDLKLIEAALAPHRDEAVGVVVESTYYARPRIMHGLSIGTGRERRYELR